MTRSEKSLFFLIAAIVCFQEMIPPVVSLGNNGDFGKVSGHFSIGYPPNLEWHYAPVKFQHQPRYEYHSAFRSSETMLAAAAVALSSVISKSGDFDIRFIGAIHAILFLGAIYLLIPVLAHFFGPRARLAILATIALVLGDVMYVSVFNTFYMDAAAMVFLLLAVVFFLRSALWRRRWDLIGLAIFCALLAIAKPQHAVLAIPAITLLIAWRKRFAAPLITWVAVAATAAGAAWTSVSLPPDYPANQWYDVIFLGLLPYSPAPADDLAEMGLDRSYVSYSRTSAYFSTGGFSHPDFTKEFWSRMGPGVLFRFYLHHPSRTFQMLLRAFAEAGNTRPDLGNFDPSAGLPPDARSHAFALWSSLREWLLASRPWCYLLSAIALQALLVVRSAPGWRVAAVSVGIGVLLEAAVAGLADATEPARHFTIFALLQDVTLIALLGTFFARRGGSVERA